MIKTYYTYLHRRTDAGEVFYVGCATKQVRRRGKDVYQRAYDFGQRNSDWIEIRNASGVEVEIDLEFADRDDAFKREKELIASFGHLTNVASGGPGMPGVKDTVESRHKKAITKIGSLNPMYGKVSPRAKAVIDTATGTTYPSVQAASQAIGYKMQTLWAMLKGINHNPTSLRFA